MFAQLWRLINFRFHLSAKPFNYIHNSFTCAVLGLFRRRHIASSCCFAVVVVRNCNLTDHKSLVAQERFTDCHDDDEDLHASACLCPACLYRTPLPVTIIHWLWKNKPESFCFPHLRHHQPQALMSQNAASQHKEVVASKGCGGAGAALG